MIHHVGLDFDNTIVIYDRVFHRYAVELYRMPADVPPNKSSVRAYFRPRPGGDDDWTELQGVVYGTKMAEAEAAPGVEHFLAQCVRRGVRTTIISHKTEFPARGPGVSLHDAAWTWLEQRGMLDEARFGLTRQTVFFEPDRSSKLARIASLGCGAFVDDLPEVFREASFPPGVMPILYDPNGQHTAPTSGIRCQTWRDVGQVIHDHTEP